MLTKTRHSVFDLEYHFVLITKYRHPVLTGTLKTRLEDILRALFTKNFNTTILEINIQPDHVHILFSATPTIQLSKLANSVKTVSSRRIRKEFSEELKPYYWKPLLWSSTYFICSVSERSHEIVQNYIAHQNANRK